MDLISTLHTKLQAVTAAFDSTNENFILQESQIRNLEEENKSIVKSRDEARVRVDEMDLEISNKASYLMKLETLLKRAQLDVECIEFSLEQLPRTIFNILNEFTNFSTLHMTRITIYLDEAIKNQFWVDRIQKSLEDIQRNRMLCLNKSFHYKMIKDTEEKDLKKLLSVEELHLHNIRADIDIFEDQILQLHQSGISTSLSNVSPITFDNDPKTRLEDIVEIVTTHTVVQVNQIY